MSRECQNCEYYDGTDTCKRYPEHQTPKIDTDTCGEFKPDGKIP